MYTADGVLVREYETVTMVIMEEEKSETRGIGSGTLGVTKYTQLAVRLGTELETGLNTAEYVSMCRNGSRQAMNKTGRRYSHDAGGETLWLPASTLQTGLPHPVRVPTNRSPTTTHPNRGSNWKVFQRALRTQRLVGREQSSQRVGSRDGGGPQGGRSRHTAIETVPNQNRSSAGLETVRSRRSVGAGSLN